MGIKNVRQGQRPSASAQNQLISSVNSVAASNHIQGFVDSTGFHTRRSPINFPIEVRLAFCRSDAPGTTWIECYLDFDTIGERVTVECSIAGGGVLNNAEPRLTDGLPLPVFEVDGTWYSLFPFQATEDCECTDDPLLVINVGTGAANALDAAENLGLGVTDSPTFAGTTVGTGGNTTTTAANGSMTQAGTATASLGNTTVASYLDSPKFKLTPLGGFAVKLTNKTGFVTVAGQVVKADPATNDAVILTGANELESIGVFLDNGVAVDAEAWVVVFGIADVAMEDNTLAARGNWVRCSVGEAGYADATNANAPQPINQTHFTEIGHCIESVAATGAGTHILARCILHFN